MFSEDGFDAGPCKVEIFGGGEERKDGGDGVAGFVKGDDGGDGGVGEDRKFLRRHSWLAWLVERSSKGEGIFP